jgi:hypothetical protein
MKSRYIALLLLFSCHSRQEPTVRLTAAAIGAGDSVEKALGPGLRKATAAAYYRLGDSLLEKGYCDTAIKAFQVAERLNFQPRADLLYKLSAGYAGKAQYFADPEDSCLQAATRYAELAIQMGYGHPENFRSDRLFADLKENGFFIQTCAEALSGTGKPGGSDKTLWESFVNQFSPLPLPLTIDQGWVGSHPPRREIAYVHERFVPEMRTTKFTRGTEYLYYYVGSIRQTPDYTALLYAGKSLELMRDADDDRATFFFLVSYDRDGRIVDKLLAAGRRDLTEPARTLTLQSDLNFTIKSFRNIYARDPEKAGYENNPIVRSEPAGETGYRITPTGKFEQLQPALAMVTAARTASASVHSPSVHSSDTR